MSIVSATPDSAKTHREVGPIKGPGFRLDQDVRRIWRCPKCDRVLKTHGSVSSRRCGCQDNGTWMQLVEKIRKTSLGPRPSLLPPIDAIEPVPVLADQAEEGSSKPRKESRKQKRRRQRESTGKSPDGESPGEQAKPPQGG